LKAIPFEGVLKRETRPFHSGPHKKIEDRVSKTHEWGLRLRDSLEKEPFEQCIQETPFLSHQDHKKDWGFEFQRLTNPGEIESRTTQKD
jgi:hypothetical protein